MVDPRWSKTRHQSGGRSDWEMAGISVISPRGGQGYFLGLEV